MLIKALLVLFLILTGPPLQAKEHVHLPKEFNIIQQRGNQIPSYLIHSGYADIAMVYRNIKDKSSYELYCPLGHYIASAESRAIEKNTFFEIYDEKHYPLGRFEKGSENYKTIYYLYLINSSKPLLIANFNLLYTEILIYDAEFKEMILKLKHPLKKTLASWEVSIKNPLLLHEKKIDTRLLLLNLILLIEASNS